MIFSYQPESGEQMRRRHIIVHCTLGERIFQISNINKRFIGTVRSPIIIMTPPIKSLGSGTIINLFSLWELHPFPICNVLIIIAIMCGRRQFHSIQDLDPQNLVAKKSIS